METRTDITGGPYKRGAWADRQLQEARRGDEPSGPSPRPRPGHPRRDQSALTIRRSDRRRSRS